MGARVIGKGCVGSSSHQQADFLQQLSKKAGRRLGPTHQCQLMLYQRMVDDEEIGKVRMLVHGRPVE